MEPEEPVHRLARHGLDAGRVEEAKEAGRRLKAHGITFDLAFTSALIRAQHALDLTLRTGPDRPAREPE